MGVRDSKRLVVDTNVLCGAGAADGPASQCREFLGQVHSLQHRIVMTPALNAEFSRHRSRFGTRWLAQMRDGNLVCDCHGDAYSSFAIHVKGLAIHTAHKAAMLKDRHLISAAIETDHRIASVDDAARTLLRKAAGSLSRLGSIVWVNPTSDEEAPLAWLQQGAPDEEHRRLGFQEPKGRR